MKNVSAGVGALAFAILTFVAAIIESGPGGTYKASNVAKFVDSGHRPVVFVSLYMAVLGAAGLLLLLARLRALIADASRSSVFWALTVAGVGAWIAGWAVGSAVPIVMGYGGKHVTLAPTLTYTLSTTGAVIISAGAILVGCALLTLTLGPVVLPSWVRWSTLVAGIAALAAPAWFPLFLVYIWAAVIGIWLLATRDRATASSPAHPV